MTLDDSLDNRWIFRWLLDRLSSSPHQIEFHFEHSSSQSFAVRFGDASNILIQKRVFFLQIPSGNQTWLAGEIPKNGAVNGENKWTWHIYDINVVFSSQLWWHPSGVSAKTMGNWVPLGPHLDDPSPGGKRGERLSWAFRHQIRETTPLIMEIVGSLYPYHIITNIYKWSNYIFT